MVVDRFARDCLADAFEAYLAGQEDLDGLCSRLRGLSDATEDETVRRTLKETDEDGCLAGLRDRAADLTKDDWDTVQRTLLLLRSDAHLIVETRWVWDRKQLVAFAATGLFSLGVFCLDWGPAIFWFSLPYGLLVWRLWVIPSETQAVVEPQPLPFGSRQEIAAVRRRVRRFRKRPFPGDPRRRRWRARPDDGPKSWSERMFLMLWLRCIAFLSPLFLAVAMFPYEKTTYRVEWP